MNQWVKCYPSTKHNLQQMVEFRANLGVELQRLPLSVLYPLRLWFWVVFFIQLLITWALITLYNVKQQNGLDIAGRLREWPDSGTQSSTSEGFLLARAASPFAIMGHEFGFLLWSSCSIALSVIQVHWFTRSVTGKWEKLVTACFVSWVFWFFVNIRIKNDAHKLQSGTWRSIKVSKMIVKEHDLVLFLKMYKNFHFSWVIHKKQIKQTF